MEPWNPALHRMTMAEAWAECARRVPTYVKNGVRHQPPAKVQEFVMRVGREVFDPTIKTHWKSDAGVRQRVEKVVAMMAATRRYEHKFPLFRQQGSVKPENADVKMP